MPAILIDNMVVNFSVQDGAVSFNGKIIGHVILRDQEGRLLVKIGNSVREIIYFENEENIEISTSGGRSTFKVLSDRDLFLRNFQSEKSSRHLHSEIKAPMPGLVVTVLVKKGDSIKQGATLAILEAMKMENEIRTPRDAEVADVLVKDGDVVEKDQVIVTLQ
ncbi:MAG: acetyl-CoA carboxylase biotin carboxyl carrier protein subunit [Bacteroidetes bacterium]|nr:acetyl-CoA carboxylase biotin carboxyl carrier protein subunit [Bacteroidota bacterium]MCL5737371.1 acetyl-CoA carboxylase biotin carboxyl carrier protein subunit [Bacteroidota bacterium]